MQTYYQVTKTGSLRDLRRITSQIPSAKDGQVVVEVKSIGINYADIFAIMGLYSATPKTPFIPGLEFSGKVLSSDSPLYSTGMDVIGVTRFGGYTSHIVADPDYLMPLPEGWSYDEGCAFPVQTLTAYYALKSLGDLQPNQTVLIHSAAGGVGLQANRIAKKFGAFTIGVVGNEAKVKILRDEGYDKAIVRNKKSFISELRNSLGGRELNLVLEATGGKYFRDSYEVMAPMGRVIAYGSAQFTPASHKPNYLTLVFKYLFRPRVDPLSMIKANKSVMGFNLIWLYERKMLMKSLLEEIAQLKLPPPVVGHRIPFSNLPDALELMRKGNTIGKVVIYI
jgi:NADPH:quinone reductase-like Zn-dependent oxidoreductase